MKSILINLLIAIPIFSFGQVTGLNQKDTCDNQSRNIFTGIEKTLPIFKVDSCFFDILSTIVNKDSLCDYYIKNKTAYLLSINKQEGFYSIEIRPMFLDLVVQADYFGIFEFNNRKFLCWGCKLDEIFKESTTDSINIKFNLDDSKNEFYLGGDVPSRKELVICKGLKFYFIITAWCK